MTTVEQEAVSAVETERPRARRGPAFLVWLAVGWLALLVLAALFAPLLPLADPAQDVGRPRQPLFASLAEPLGTDGLGRSVLSRLVYGARASLQVGVLAILVGLVLGGLIGLLAGYFRKAVDFVIGVATDAVLAFPGLVLLLAIGAIMGPGLPTVIIGLAALSLPMYVRMTRANTLRFTEREFVQAARLTRAPASPVITREILPNVIPPLLAYSVVVMASLITAEAAISYLGIGIMPPTPSWGAMIADGQFELARNPQLVFVPAVVLALTVFAFSVVGDWGRARLDVGGAKV
jgi:peptide/nickel transport system permease protein